MRWSVALLAVALLPVGVRADDALLSPANVVVLAYADAETLTPDVAIYTRYLWLPNLTEKERAAWKVVLDAHANQLSRESDLVPTRTVKGAGGHLLAVNLLDYGWKAEVWDQFADTDHTFYATVVTAAAVTTVVVVEIPEKWYTDPDTKKQWGYGRSGQVIVRGEVPKTPAETKTRAFAPWLVRSAAQKRAVEGLAALTHAQAPIVNALVFFDNSASAGDGRKPSYYDFLGVKTEADFQKVIGAEVVKDVAFATDLLAAVGFSGITQEERAIQRLEKRGGAYWRSFDVNKGTAVGGKNALRILGSKEGKLTLEFDATEQYGHLANGLFAFLLANNKGVAQDRAPDTIAADPVAIVRNNHSVKICVSCIRCHTTGLQDVDDWVRNFPPELDILAGDRSGKKFTDYEDVKRLRQQYARKLDPFLKQDRERYATALNEITGLKPEKYAGEFARAWSQAADAVVDLDYAARELGVPPETIVAAVRHQVALGKADPVLAQFALPAVKRKGLPLSSWREAYGLMQQYLAEVPR